MSGYAYALLTGSGKDATLALHRGRAEGLEITTAVSLFDAASGRIAFHGTRIELVAAQHEALGLRPVIRPVDSGGFDTAFARALDELVALGLRGMVLGNIHLADIRGWYEERITARGLEHVEPLWGDAPGVLVREVVEAGYRAVVVSVMNELGDRAWVGRVLDRSLIEEIEATGADPCGERGEYHSFVYDGPSFRRPVRYEVGESIDMLGHHFTDLRLSGVERTG